MKPVLWIHKASGRIRFQGEGLPNSWMPLYAKEDLELDPLQREDTPDLTDKARRIWDYVKNRKVPFEAVTVAEHFSNSTAAITKHLNTLYAAGMLTRTRKANKVFWAIKHARTKETESKPTEAPVAVSKPSVKPQPSRPAPGVWPDNPYKKQTSYPNIRGYDD